MNKEDLTPQRDDTLREKLRQYLRIMNKLAIEAGRLNKLPTW